jgi:hypothetical protein
MSRSKIYEYALYDGARRMHSIQNVQSKLLGQLRDVAENAPVDLKATTMHLLTRSLESVNAFDAKMAALRQNIATKELELSNAAAESKDSLSTELQELKQASASYHFNIRTHKMREVLSGAKTFLEEDGVFETLTRGETPFDRKLAFTRLTADLKSTPKDYWGTSKSTIVSAAVTYALAALGQNLEGIMRNSPITHSSPCDTTDIPLDGILFQEGVFRFIHSGYAFGGHRDVSGSCNADNPPEDCGSWIEAVCGVRGPMTTADIALLSAESQGICQDKVASWVGSTGSKAAHRFSVVSGDLRIGDILCSRNGVDHANPIGKTGHIGIVVNATEPPTIISFNRDMPHLEGVVLQSMPTPFDASKLRIAVRLTDESSIPQPQNLSTQPAEFVQFVEQQIGLLGGSSVHDAADA